MLPNRSRCGFVATFNKANTKLFPIKKLCWACRVNTLNTTLRAGLQNSELNI